MLASAGADARADAGGYAIAASAATGAGLANYTISYADGLLTVDPRHIAVTALGGSSIYGDTAANPGLSASNLAGFDTVAALTGLTNSFGITGTTSAGDYALDVAGALGNANYVIDRRIAGNWSVAARPITVTADDLTRIYGDANPALTYTIGGMGLVNGDTLTGALATTATAQSDVGGYTIGRGSIAASADYALTFAPVTLTIDPRHINVTALGGTSIYGEAAVDPGLAATNLADFDDVSALTGLANSFGIDGASHAGDYALAVAGTLGNPNYVVDQRIAGSWTVAARPITVTASDASRIYGEANPALAYAVGGMGLVNGDTLIGTLATRADVRSSVGDYAITSGSLAASPNYALSFDPGTLTITPRAISVTADDQSKRWDANDPPLTWTVGGMGLVNGDTLSGALARAPLPDALPRLSRRRFGNPVRGGPMMRCTLLAAPALLLAPLAAHAQVVERHLPPAPAERGHSLATPNALPADQDATPIGPPLAGIVMLGAEDKTLAAPAAGIDTSRVARLDTARAHALLGGYLGRPLSRRLIGEVEAAIARYYRAQGYPFVALSTPEQEVTSGVLQVRVVEFSAGRIAVTGAKNESDAYILGRIRQQTGAPIVAGALSEDLDWLNRNPFRSARALFSPGDALGRSDLTLALDETRPWRVYAGVANSGAAATGRTRLFAGIQAAPIPGVPDAVFAYQFTASDDVFDTAYPAYVSHAGLADIGIAPRQAIEITLDHVGVNQPSGPFVVRQRIDEATLGWRVGAGAIGDLRLGVEARHARRTVRFGGTPIITAGADIIQLYGGVEKAGVCPLGGYTVSATLHVNPGRIGDANDGATLLAYTNGRVRDARYAYLDMRYAGAIRLGRGFSLGTEIIGRLASGPLPDTEQIGIGGADLVRGYTLDDGAFDSGIVVRNTIHAPPVSLFRDPKLSDALDPYLFFDAGYASERATLIDTHPASAGVGASYRLGRYLTARIEAARALHTAAYTRNGDWRAHFSVSISY